MFLGGMVAWLSRLEGTWLLTSCQLAWPQGRVTTGPARHSIASPDVFQRNADGMYSGAEGQMQGQARYLLPWYAPLSRNFRLYSAGPPRAVDPEPASLVAFVGPLACLAFRWGAP